MKASDPSLGRMMFEARRSIKPGGVTFSAEAMRNALGVSLDTVQRWETDRVTPRRDQLEDYLNVLVKKGLSHDIANHIFSFAFPKHSLEVHGEPSDENSAGAEIEARIAIARAEEFIDQRTKIDLRTASELVARAIELNPESAIANARFAYITMLRLHYSWESREIALSLGRKHAEEAIRIDPEEPWSHIAMGFVKLHLKSVGDSADCFTEAIRLNSKLPFAYVAYGAALAYLGQGVDALRQIDLADNIGPTLHGPGDLGARSNVRASAHFVLEQYEKGFEVAEKAVKENPELITARRNLVVHYALAGMIKQAQAALKHLVARRKGPSVEPLSLRLIEQQMLFVRATDQERFLRAFKLAGLK
jgi:tetratricopeptide (TPR) repeat protein